MTHDEITIEPATDRLIWAERGDVLRVRAAGYKCAAIIYPDDGRAFYVRAEDDSYEQHPWYIAVGYFSAQLAAIEIIKRWPYQPTAVYFPGRGFKRIELSLR